MATAQQFDTLDGLVVTGQLNTGTLITTGNVVVDTNVLYVDTTNNRIGINKVPTVAFDVSGDVNIDGGTIDGLTQLSVDNLTLDGRKISSSANLDLEATGRAIANTTDGIFRFDKNGTPYGEITGTSTSMVITSGPNTVPAITLDITGNTILTQNLSMSNGKKIDFGSVMDITASATGATFSANTYHQGYIVSNFGGAQDVNTYLQFNAGDSFQITTGGTVRFTANNSGVTIPGALLFDSVASDQPIYETVNTTASRSINLQNGSAVVCTATGGGAVTFTMPTSPGTNSFAWTVKFNNSGSLTWPASVEWAEGVQPPESTGTDIYSFVTYDGGTTIYGSLAVRNAS
jgi:hypothetical protein